MKKRCFFNKNVLMTFLILCLAFSINLILQKILTTNTLITAIFVLAVFLVSLLTDSYIYGVIATFVSMLIINYAFTFPYAKFNFTIPENIVSAAIMIIVALITCALTVRIKRQEIIKIESEKERMRANLLRSISHDLRTPLTTIYSSSSALIENKDNFNEEQKLKMLKGIKDDSDWLMRMVENILSITRLDSGNVKILKTSTVIDELIDSVLVKFKNRYPQQDVSIDIPDDFIAIPMDAILIQQVLVNLLDNAVRHAKNMTKLSLKVFVISQKAIFEIEDDGCGIDETKLNDIFSDCYSVTGRPYDSQKSNSGIGLSVCATIIKAHGGDIKAENKKNGGSIFRFSLNMEDEISEQQ